MPRLACKNDKGNCGHEFESMDPNAICEWCGGTTFVALKQTGLEKMLGVNMVEGACCEDDENDSVVKSLLERIPNVFKLVWKKSLKRFRT